jgi:hypothetical protein
MANVNHDFHRRDAHLAVIFLTDAADSSPDVSASEMASILRAQAHDDLQVWTYGVIARFDDMIRYSKDPTKYPLKAREDVDPILKLAGRGPFKIWSLLQATKGNGFDLNDSEYGRELATMGSEIAKRSFYKVLPLDHTPDITQPIIVKYGKQVIPKDDKVGWEYNSEKQTITIHEGVKLEYQKDAKLTIEYTPVNI